MSYVQTNRSVSVDCALGADVLLFQELQTEEEVGRLFEFRLTLASVRDDIAIADVLGKGMTVSIKLPAGGRRHFHGIVTRFASSGWHGAFARYDAVLRPALWLLGQASNCRIFQNLGALDIVRKVCAASGYGAVELDVSRLSASPAPREYCVQYRETDLDFVCRLLEEEGIYFYFVHGAGKHRVVFADSISAHNSAPGCASLKFRAEEHAANVDEAVSDWRASGGIVSSMVALNDYDFEKVTSKSRALLVKSGIPAPFGQASYERYDYPGGYLEARLGARRARARMESLHGQSERMHGKSRAAGLACGALFSLAEHPRAGFNREYLVTRMQTTLVCPDYRSGGADMEIASSFEAIGSQCAYAPERRACKPRIPGAQTAVVVGPSGEEIHTDRFGRVKLQFHWDREGKDDEHSSCWVRVAQAWAGKGWGGVFIPRVGMEVVVQFIDGDPDRPLVTGCVYNGDALPPYPLPADKTRAALRSNSSKGGGGCNEWRFEDKKDAEEIFVQAERDHLRVVKNNDVLKVGFGKKDKGDQTVQIHHDQLTEVGHDQVSRVGNDSRVEVDHDMALKVGNRQDTHVGAKCVLEAGASIELKVGASSILIEPAGITIKAPKVDIASDALMSVKAGAVMTIEGALVKIN